MYTEQSLHSRQVLQGYTAGFPFRGGLGGLGLFLEAILAVFGLPRAVFINGDPIYLIDKGSDHVTLGSI